MNELSQLAAELGTFCETRGWRSCVIGGFAVQHWGEPRMTMDVDLSLLTGFGEEEAFVDEFLRHYDGRLPDAKNFALQNRVLLLRHSSGVGNASDGITRWWMVGQKSPSLSLQGADGVT